MKSFRCKTSPCTNENYAIYFASNLMLSGKEKVYFFGPISSRLMFTSKNALHINISMHILHTVL